MRGCWPQVFSRTPSPRQHSLSSSASPRSRCGRHAAGSTSACSCFGRSERELGKDTLVTSLMLAGATLAYWVLLRTHGRVAHPRRAAPRRRARHRRRPRWAVAAGRGRAGRDRPSEKAARQGARRTDGSESLDDDTDRRQHRGPAGSSWSSRGSCSSRWFDSKRRSASSSISTIGRFRSAWASSRAGLCPSLHEPPGRRTAPSRDGVLVLLSVNCTTCRLVAAGLRDVRERVRAPEDRHGAPGARPRRGGGDAGRSGPGPRRRSSSTSRTSTGQPSGSTCAPRRSSSATGSSARGRSFATRASSTSSSKDLKSPTKKEEHVPETPIVSTPT